jgi:hypothetical protein
MINTTVTPAPVVANWKDQKNKLRNKFTVLTDADLNFEESKKEEMLDKIQVKLGITKEVLAAVIA